MVEYSKNVMARLHKLHASSDDTQLYFEKVSTHNHTKPKGTSYQSLLVYYSTNILFSWLIPASKALN